MIVQVSAIHLNPLVHAASVYIVVAGSVSIVAPSMCRIFGPRRVKTCHRRFANNKGADQPAHPRSLISAIVFRFLESIICELATDEMSIFYLVSVAEETCLKLALSDTPKTGSLATRPICSWSWFCGTVFESFLSFNRLTEREREKLRIILLYCSPFFMCVTLSTFWCLFQNAMGCL